jgi:hypothetical protein
MGIEKAGTGFAGRQVEVCIGDASLQIAWEANGLVQALFPRQPPKHDRGSSGLPKAAVPG